MSLKLIGQNKASGILDGFLKGVQDRGQFSNAILLHGPAGVGKTHVAKALADECGEIGIETVEIDSAAKLSRSDSEEIATIVGLMKASQNGVRTLLFIDEAHCLPLVEKASQSPVQRLFHALIFGSGEGWGRAGSVEFLGNSVGFNTRYLSLCLMTNFPHRMGGGKNPQAMARRFLNVELTRYTAEEMRKIIPLYFAGKGVKIDPQAGKLLVKMHRGTCEALDDFVKKADGQYDPQVGVTVDDLNRILPLCDYTLRGFRVDEIRVMEWLRTTTEPRRRANLAQHFPNVDMGELYRHGQRQETRGKGPDGEPVVTPFVIMDAKNQYAVTPICEAFLKKNAPLFAQFE